MSITLSPEEIALLTGYRRAAEQLAALQRMGFWRARRDRFGRVVLERAHYDAVASGRGAAANDSPPVRPRPKLRPVTA